ncbi:Uncharacterised protein [Mycobacteroides abscessus subsp. abscessus]|nr:Uncharacterised protein [Mycobacteroides abscessus subsp. abscessus]
MLSVVAAKCFMATARGLEDKNVARLRDTRDLPGWNSGAAGYRRQMLTLVDPVRAGTRVETVRPLEHIVSSALLSRIAHEPAAVEPCALVIVIPVCASVWRIPRQRPLSWPADRLVATPGVRNALLTSGRTDNT